MRHSVPAVKICGVCRPEDARTAVEAGADYVGVVLAPGGGRSQSLERARELFDAVGDAARRVGVFVDTDAAEIQVAARRLGLDVLQLHGGEPPELVESLRRAGPWRVWKAIRPRSGAEFAAAVERYAGHVDGIVVDGWSSRAPGGTGERFPWREVAEHRGTVPAGVLLVVAGGLDPENVARAVALLRPDVVDVSSGVEAAVGAKDTARVAAFAAAARADTESNTDGKD